MMTDCKHKYIKKVRNYGKNSKPSYKVCKKCDEIITREHFKNNNTKKSRKKVKRK